MSAATTTTEASAELKATPKVLVAILAMCSLMMAYAAFMPILSEIQYAFPEASASSVQMVYTMAMLISLPAMLGSGVLVRWISKKALCIAGCVIVALGCFPAFAHGSLIELYIGSGLVGAGAGFINIISSTLISDYYKGVEKGKVMGYQSAALSLLSAVLAFASGQIAVIWSWEYTFLLFVVAIPVAVVIALCLPKDTPLAKLEAEQAARGGQDAQAQAPEKPKTFTKGVVVWIVLAGVWSIFMYAFNTNIAMFIDSQGFGGADVAGGVTTMFTLIGVPAGLVVGACVAALKRNTVAAACAFCAAGMVVVAVAPNIFVVYAGAFLFGLGFAIRNPCVVTFVAYIVPEAGVAGAIGVLQAIGTVAGFVSPYIINAIGALFGGDMRMIFLVSGIALAIITIGYYVLNPVKNEDIENEA